MQWEILKCARSKGLFLVQELHHSLEVICAMVKHSGEKDA